MQCWFCGLQHTEKEDRQIFKRASTTACGAASSSTAASEGSSAAPSTAETSTTEKATVAICGTNGKGDTQSIAHETFAELLNETGLFEATAMVSSEMGSTDDVLEQAMAGAGVIAATDPARLASYVPEFGILMMPYMFDSYDELDNLMDADLYKTWTEDLKGLKIRTMGSAISVNSVNAMGAIATSLNQSDAYNAIETGVVDGGEWQIPTIYSLRMYEVCDHISLTGHFLLTGSIVCGTSWYDTLTEEQQKALNECAVEAYGTTKEMVMEYEQKYLEEMEANGVTITEPDKEAFRAATEYLYTDEATTGGADFASLREELYEQLGIER